MDTSLTDDAPTGQPLLLRMLVVAGALFGFTLLALAVSSAADASEGAPPDQHSLLGRLGNTAHDVLKPVAPALEPVTGAVHVVSSQVAPVVKPVTNGLEPVLAPLARPVLDAAEPVLSALRPVTRPVLHAVSPVTSPVLHATAPLTAPVVRAVGGERVVPAVIGQPVTGQPETPAPHGDAGFPPAAAGAPVASPRPVAQHTAGVSAVRHVAGHLGSGTAGTAGPMSGSGGGGMPADLSGMSGAMSASTGSAHGGEFAVTASGSGMPGTDRTWRAPPAGAWSLHWLEYYGNDHPS
ncbi:hypothetical protein Amsp01_094750 [Amycolatopsis sp. NBRC 101858]|uniref:hypothetical protein n=1 Tax=Amycolatopsis sp. NBRC 101858 TaxID=3032200 RepID=UPI0024A17177|nr:hypothetical protein [Amycolatopsis sp. NBRC 101858]GLY43452.1 hypothetical protein Amsp01_094750 [Amycolatopsis sp. NBRC 101858]